MRQDPDSVAYQPRGNRCEGLYDQPFASRINLRIAGFHRDAPSFDPLTTASVRMVVERRPNDREVLLRVVSTRWHQYFQMDTSAVAADGSFAWRFDVVRKMKEPLRPFDTAAVACISGCSGDRSQRATLLPVSFSDAAVKGDRPAPVVLALADVELLQLTATLRQGGRAIFEDRPAGRRYLPPEEPIRIPIDGAGPGEALLSLAAVTKGNQRDYLEVVLVLPGRER